MKRLYHLIRILLVQPKNLESRDVYRIIDEVVKQYQYANNVIHTHSKQEEEVKKNGCRKKIKKENTVFYPFTLLVDRIGYYDTSI